MTLDVAVAALVPGPVVGPAIDPETWNALFGWLDTVERATGIPVIGAVAYGLVGTFVLREVAGSFTGDGDRAESGESGGSVFGRVRGADSSASESGDDGDVGAAGPDGDPLAEKQRNLMAAPGIEWDTRAPRVGDQFTKTFYVDEFPDAPRDGFLSEVFSVTEAEFDLTTYVKSKNQNRARERLRDRADELQVDAEIEDSARANALQAEAAKAADTHRAVKEGEKVFGLSMYVTVRADTREDLADAERTLREALREDPANLAPKTAIAKQDLALQSAAPVGPDALGNTDPDFHEHTALAGGVGALLASPHNPTLIEEGGIEFGKHKTTQTPIIADPYARDDGYARFLIGDTGSGKSHDGKLTFARMMAQREDCIGIVLEPLGNWTGVAEALDAEHITVGGDKGLNPLEIKPTPRHARRGLGQDASPYKNKVGDVLAFFDNYFELRGVSLGDRLPTLELAVDRTYHEAGITEDIDTHGNESPTLRDLIDELETIYREPGQFVTRIDAEREGLRDDAQWLLRQLRPFEANGRYENLGRESEIDLTGEDVVYLDLAQQEGQVSDDAKLIMQLLVSLVYQRAKLTQQNVVFAIDEFRYVLEDAVNLRVMETVFRHHRHHGLSPWIMTQTVDEFLDRPEAQAILDNCSIKQFHSLDGMDEELAEEFDLNWAQMDFVRNKAQPGSEALGYSDSLLGVDGDWRKVEIHSLPAEFDVVEYDPIRQRKTDLPGITENDLDPAPEDGSGDRTGEPPATADDGDDETADDDAHGEDVSENEFTWLDSEERERLRESESTVADDGEGG